jgi:hypothetical protein
LNIFQEEFSYDLNMNKTEIFYLLTGFFAGFFLRHFFQDLLKEEENNLVELPDSHQPTQIEEEPIQVLTSPPPIIDIKRVFIASRMGDPLTPDEVIFDTKGITFNVKTLLSGTESFVLYSDISGVEVFESIFFATIIIKPKARGEIKIENFSKKDARLIKNYIAERLF